MRYGRLCAESWSRKAALDERRKPEGTAYYCAYASRRDGVAYVHGHQEILDRYGSDICFQGRVPDALSDDLGNHCYLTRLTDKKDIDPFFRFVTERK